MTIRPLTAPRVARRRSSSRPRVEPLEGRSLMAGLVVDPGFNGGVPLYNAESTTTAQNAASAVAVQPDGKIVVAGSISRSLSNRSAGTALTLRRFNADGSADATFGTGGEAVVPLAIPAGQSVSASSNVLIQPDGKIVLAADLGTLVQRNAFKALTPEGTQVVRLNADGSLDAAFGTGGVTTITTNDAYLTHLALQGDGKVVLAGLAVPAGATSASYAAARLDATGAVDPTFNGGNLVVLDAATFGSVGESIFDNNTVVITDSLNGVFPTAGGSALLALRGGVAALSADGSIDATFGTAGTGLVPTPGQGITAAARQADGKILLAGPYSYPNNYTLGSGVFRLNADGSLDPTFAATVQVGSRQSGRGPTTLLAMPDGRVVVGGGSDFDVARLTATGGRDLTFGVGGVTSIPIFRAPIGGISSDGTTPIRGLALASNGEVIAVGTAEYQSPFPGTGFITFRASQYAVARFQEPQRLSGQNGDYDGDNVSDVAAQLADQGIFAVRTAVGVVSLNPFGATGVGAMIPVSGDFDGDGKADMAVYLPALASFAIHPSGGTPNVLIDLGFAAAGPGAAIPFVFGNTLGVYLPIFGSFLPVSPTGVPQSGRAVSFIYTTPFGPAGPGEAIPAVADYDGDGTPDLAVYMPRYGAFAIRPSSNTYAPYLVPFGQPGAGNTVPAPGDYDGDGKADPAAYIPSLALFAFRRSAGGPDALIPFGGPGAGRTVPATANPTALPALVSARSFRAAGPAAEPGVDFPLTEEMLAEIAGGKKKPRA